MTTKSERLEERQSLEFYSQGHRIPILVHLDPGQLLKLLNVRQFACPKESWDKTIGDAIDIALEEYEKLIMLESGEGE